MQKVKHNWQHLDFHTKQKHSQHGEYMSLCQAVVL